MLEIQTHVGSFRFEAFVSSGKSPTLERVKPLVDLPKGMSVLSSQAVLLRLHTEDAIEQLAFKCTLQNEFAGSPCTGEGLEAQEWEANGYVVTVGTEDALFLGRRNLFLGLGEEDSIAEYLPNSVAISLSKIPSHSALSLHFVVAENLSPEPVECSTWFAVDVAHEKLLSQIAA
jgi:hypothetical protein